MVTSSGTGVHTVGVSSDPYSLHFTTGSFFWALQQEYQRAGISYRELILHGQREGKAMLPVWVENMKRFPTPEGRHPLSHSGEMESEGEQP